MEDPIKLARDRNNYPIQAAILATDLGIDLAAGVENTTFAADQGFLARITTETTCRFEISSATIGTPSKCLLVAGQVISCVIPKGSFIKATDIVNIVPWL